MTAAQILEMARRRGGLTQRQLAERTGVSQPTIARIERSRMEPTFHLLSQLLGACGMEMVPIDEPRAGDIDVTQIVERRRWTPQERFEGAAQAANEFRRLFPRAAT